MRTSFFILLLSMLLIINLLPNNIIASEVLEGNNSDSLVVSNNTDIGEDLNESTIFDSFLTNPYFVILGWIIGLVAGLLQITSYIRDKKAHGYLMEKAKLELKGNYTKEQIDELSSILKKLEKQIKNELPRLAKQIIRNKQKHELAKQIKNYYSDYKKVESYEDDSDIILDPKIISAIEGEVIYSLSHNKSKITLQYILAGISILVLINVAPYFRYYADEIFGLEYIFLNFFKRFNPYQVSIYIITLLILSFSIRKFNIGLIKNQSRVINSNSFKYLMYSIWLLTLYEVYFEPIPLGQTWCVIGAVLTIIPFVVAQVISNNVNKRIIT